MATENQIAANRRNASKSTGPRTEEGKRRSRQNAVRHGLTAETVIAGLENRSSYAQFEQAIIADYEPITAIEYQLIIRLSSLLWRLRRAVAIESGLFQIQGQIVRNRHPRKDNEGPDRPLKIFHELLAQCQDKPAAEDHFEDDGVPTQNPSQSSSQYLDVTYSFLRLVNLNNGVLERIGRYEVSLWRQVAQTLLLLESFRKGLARTIREGGY
jgi:hypothetical protein